MRCGAWAFGADWAFLNLQNDLASGWIFLGNILLGNTRDAAAFAFALHDLVLLFEIGGQDIPIMKEGVFFNTDVDKGRFKAVLQIAYFAFVNAGNNAFVMVSLNNEIFQSIFLH